MSGLPDRVARAVRDHDAFADDPDDGAAVATSTPFDARVTAAERDDGRVAFEVTVRVPMLDAVAEDDVAAVVEDGWYETFERRIAAIGAVTERERDLAPTVRREGRAAVVEASLVDVNERRGVNDAAAVVDFVEGTYVQGVVPGYEYGDPVATLIDRARAAAGDGAV